jgi:hypothetical protein
MKARCGRLIVSNTDVWNELAKVSVRLKALREREAELERMIRNGECSLEGDDYVAIVEGDQVRIEPKEQSHE